MSVVLTKPLHILLLEDNDLDAELTIAAIDEAAAALTVDRVQTEEAFLKALENPDLNLILSDYMLPGFNGVTALKLAHARRPDIPFIFVSGALGEELAVDSLQRGATDYVLKQRLERLVPAVRRALELSRERAQRRLAEQRYRLVVREVKDYAIIMTDDRGKVVMWNPGAEMILGWTEREMLGQSLSRIYTVEDQVAGVEEQERDTARIAGRAADDRWQCRKDGTRFFASGVTSLLRGESENVVGFVKILRDVSERHQAEEERARLLASEQQSRRQAEVASRAKDDFLATLSHELRTPMNAVLGWASLLSSGNATSEDIKTGLEIIERNATAQAQLIEDILDISRIVSGKIRLEMATVDLRHAVTGAVEAMRLAATAKGLELQLHDLSEVCVLGDASRLQQVVWNLISNAVKFTPRGGTVAVSISNSPTGAAQVTVTDNGIGISRDFIPFVFERFRQADSSTRRQHGGLGLGLAIVRHLVELHGGSVEAASPGTGLGATFTVTLPTITPSSQSISTSELCTTTPETSPEENDEPPIKLDGIKVLVVEDEADARSFMVRVLDKAGARVRVAGSAAHGFELFIEDAPDVLISDIAMPGQDGYSLIRRIRNYEIQAGIKPTPAAAMTAYARVADRTRAEEAGFNLHVPKPLQARTLLSAVAELSSRRSPPDPSTGGHSNFHLPN